MFRDKDYMSFKLDKIINYNRKSPTPCILQITNLQKSQSSIDKNKENSLSNLSICMANRQNYSRYSRSRLYQQYGSQQQISQQSPLGKNDSQQQFSQQSPVAKNDTSQQLSQQSPQAKNGNLYQQSLVGRKYLSIKQSLKKITLKLSVVDVVRVNRFSNQIQINSLNGKSGSPQTPSIFPIQGRNIYAQDRELQSPYSSNNFQSSNQSVYRVPFQNSQFQYEFKYPKLKKIEVSTKKCNEMKNKLKELGDKQIQQLTTLIKFDRGKILKAKKMEFYKFRKRRKQRS